MMAYSTRQFLFILLIIGSVFGLHSEVQAKRLVIALADTTTKNNPPDVAAVKNDVEVFADGKRYESFDAYRLEKLRMTLKTPSISSKEVKSDLKENQSTDVLSKENIEKIKDPDDIQTLETEDKKSEDLIDNDIDQMQQMLQEFYESHKDKDPVSIDPGKIKTLEIKPAQP